MVNDIFLGYKNLNTLTLLFGAVVYSIEMYADFSGYSDMAMGIARLLGFEVTQNFNYPFMAENIADFWRRWHISLTSWLTEYVFTPLSIAFRDYGKIGIIISIILNFIICGIWHGANWTFVIWGLMHGLYFIPLILKDTFNKRKKVVKKSFTTTLTQLMNIFGTFMLVSITLVLFRSNTLSEGFGIYKIIVSDSVQNFQQFFKSPPILKELFYIIPILLLDIYKINNEKDLKINLPNPIFRWTLYFISIVIIFYFSNNTSNSFLYTQF